MQLIERERFIDLLQTTFENVAEGEGHCILVSGEAGMGKTSLVKAFCREHKNDCKIYQGTCDALFTPRPLAPLYDIASQIRNDLWGNGENTEDRSGLFTAVFHELENEKKPVLIVFEDIHWADEATLDFIKFLSRRITRIHCLFILTYRDDEIHSRHPLRNLLGQLSPDSFTRLQLTPLSRPAVEKLALEKGYNGEDVYSISGGNPFYVNEILASYSPGVPVNIKDSILSVYNQQSDRTKHMWEILSVVPGGFESKYLEKMEPSFIDAIGDSINSKILILNDGLIFFKHELYRRTIESSLSPQVRVALNKTILNLFLESFKHNQENERIIHHAKNANEYELVEQYTPLAAARAASVGAHIEASKLYLSAIENYRGTDNNKLIELYELYAYECYLTNKHKEAIIYTEKSLLFWKEGNEPEMVGNCMRFLSRLWWFDGNKKQAESFGEQAVKVLDNQPSSKAKAMAYSNMAQLWSSMDQTKECIFWGEKAVAVAREIDDKETLAHALISMGSALMMNLSSMQNGIQFLQQSLEIALENSYHEHAARVYMILGANWVSLKEYELGKKAIDDGVIYCEERDIDSHKSYMLSWRARLNLETGNWKDAFAIASDLLKNEDLLPVVKMGALNVLATIKMRRGDQDAAVLLLEAKALAFETTELQRIVPAFLALLEYEWLTGQTRFEIEALSGAINMIIALEKFSKKSRFYFWLWKAGKDHLLPEKNYEDYEENSATTAMKQAALWEKWGCPYEQALALFEGGVADKKKALMMIQSLGANAVYEKMKSEMRASGIKSIPRGIRKTTRSNAAHLTGRELDVLKLLKEGLQNKEIAAGLFISAKTVDHHISSILFKLDVNSRIKAVKEAIQMDII